MKRLFLFVLGILLIAVTGFSGTSHPPEDRPPETTIQTFSGFGFKIETPSDKEEAARVLRHLQNIRNDYLATRGKLTKQEIDAKIARKEFWMSGKEAVEFGFADEFIK